MPLVIAMGVATTVLALVLFPRRVEPKIAVVAAESLPLKKVVTVPPVYVATVSLFASNLCFGSIMTFLPLLMLSKGITEFNVFYVAYSVTVVLSRMWIGRLCAVMRPEKLTFYVLVALGLTMLAAREFSGDWVLALCGAGVGIGYGLVFPAMATVVTANVQPANRGTAFGFYTMAIDLGFGVGAIGMGAVASAWGYQAVFAAAGVYTLVYAALYQLRLRGKIAGPAAACEAE